MTSRSPSWSRALWLAGSASLVLAVGCFGTEIPPQKPEQSPLAGLPTAKPTSDATKIEDQPDARKPASLDEKATGDAIARATRQAVQCAQINPEGPFGEFSLTLVLSGAGKIAEARLPAELADRPVARCIKNSYEAESIPPWQGAPVNRTVKLTLKKPDAPADAKPVEPKPGTRPR